MAGRPRKSAKRAKVLPKPLEGQELKRTRDYLIAKTDLTIFERTYSRGQYFPSELFRRLPERRRMQLREMRYIREPESGDGVSRCDFCGGEFCRSEYTNRHGRIMHPNPTPIVIGGPQLSRGEDPRHPTERAAPLLTDAEFEARVAV